MDEDKLECSTMMTVILKCTPQREKIWWKKQRNEKEKQEAASRIDRTHNTGVSVDQFWLFD